jgi:hypothetical protein
MAAPRVVIKKVKPVPVAAHKMDCMSSLLFSG